MGFFTVLVYVIVSFFTGILFMGLSLDFIDVNLAFIYISNEVLSDTYSRLILGILGLLIILFCLRYLQSLFLKLRRYKSITFESTEGEVDITLFAIEDMLRRLLENNKEISHVRPKIFSKKKSLKVVIRGDLASEMNIVEFTKEVQDKIKEKLKTLLGEDKEIKVKLVIRRMVFGGKKKLEEEPEIPFRKY